MLTRTQSTTCRWRWNLGRTLPFRFTCMDSTVISRASSLLKNVWFAAWGHAAYKISSEIGMPCRPGALTGRLFERAPRIVEPLKWSAEATHTAPKNDSTIQRFNGQTLHASPSLGPLHCGAFAFTLGVPFLDVLAFVVLDFAFAHGEGDFHQAIFPVETERYQRIALDRSETEQFANFGFAQEQFARRLGLMVLEVAVGIFVDVRVVKPDFLVFNTRESIADLALARPQRLDF